MAVVAKMVNPTPFDVKILYDKGVYIRVPADGEADLSMQQLDDFRPGKPGSEATKEILDWEGVFLQDTDLSYDYQALQALRTAVRKRKERIKNFIERTRGARISGGVAVSEEEINELMETSGHARMERDVEKLEARIKILEKTVDADTHRGAVRQMLDPTRTCFVLNPPRQFPSKTALEMFLAENPEIKAQHDAYLNPAPPAQEEAPNPGGF